MLLSIIVAAYNKEKYIPKCLESLMQIKESDVEFIVVNDGSTDGTAKVCEYYEQIDTRIHVINKENSGVSGARNTGLEHSKGKYISFVDADDEITEAYSKIIDIIKGGKEDLYSFDYCEQQANTVKNRKKTWLIPGKNDRETLLNSFLTGLSNSVCTNIYLSSIIDEYDIRFTLGMTMGEDCEFNSKYVKYCTGIYYIDEVCYKYNVDNFDSATHKQKLSYLKDFERMYQGFLSVYQLEENLNFSFDSELYLGLVYGIIRTNAEIMTTEENRAFRNSLFYKKIMSYKSNNMKTNLKRWFIKSNLYRIIRF